MGDRYRKLERTDYDVIVVGAGLGGLVAAAILAKQGKSTLVLDQHSVAGGNTTIFKRTGYEFDVGLHYIGDCGPEGGIPRILRAAGVDDLEYEEMDPDGYDTYVFPDFQFRMPKGLKKYEQRLLEQFPNERYGVKRYIKLVKQLGKLQKARSGWPMLLALPSCLLAARWANKTIGEFLDTCTKDEKLKTVLVGQHGDYGLPPSKASVPIACGLTMHYLDGAYYPKGGGQILSDKLAESIERNGGKILLLSKVERILVEEGRATGVEFTSKHCGRVVATAPVVISNADLKHTMRDLVGSDNLRPETLQRVEGYEMAPALGMLYLGVNRNLTAEESRRTNYWIYPDYDLENRYALIARGQFDPNPFAYISIASLKDPTNTRIAPPGITNLQVMSLAPASPQAWGVTEQEFQDGSYRKSPAYQRIKREYSDRLLKTAEIVFPGLKDQIVYEELATPLTHRRYTNSTDGTSYGIAATPEQFLGRRPGSRTEIEGFYLCGASCRTAHGIGGVAHSGLVVAQKVLGGGRSHSSRAAKPSPRKEPASEHAAATEVPIETREQVGATADVESG